MVRSIVTRGRLSDPRHIELSEPVRGMRGDVEVRIRQISEPGAHDVFDVISKLPPGSRSKANIDRQIHDERLSWSDQETNR